jgi:23S rRNA (adenine2503-C2)-methyltransferase
MGEPLINFDQVEKAIEIFTNNRMFGMSPRRITLSTVGIIPGLRRLIESSLRVHLAVSVHAPDDELRRWLIPIPDAHPLDEVLRLAHKYASDRDVRLTAEYVLLRGVNDSPEHAIKLAEVLKGKVRRINLIPYNPTTAGFEAPTPEAVLEFQRILKERGYTVTVRRSVGRDVEAACGMLRRRRLDEKDS